MKNFSSWSAGFESWRLLLASGVLAGLLVGCSGSGSDFDLKSPNTVTKSELLERIRPFDPRFSGIEVATAARLKEILGEPSDIKKLGNWEYWQYACSDGIVQIQMIDTQITGGRAHLKSVDSY